MCQLQRLMPVAEYRKTATAEKMSFQQDGVEVKEFECPLETYPVVLFAKFSETFQLQEINPSFDEGKQPDGVGDKVFTRTIHV